VTLREAKAGTGIAQLQRLKAFLHQYAKLQRIYADRAIGPVVIKDVLTQEL
jgi:hypothetical protein